jgi:riboflavin kinase / FMN adenylyltransferase
VKVKRGIPPSLPRTPCALTIGNFDGVHLGHQALLAKLRAHAQEYQLQTCLLTFEPHPKEFFNPQNAPPRILNLRDKLEALKNTGIDLVVVEHFNANFAKKTPEEFVRDIIVQGLNTRHIVIGDDFHYGSKRAGNLETLEKAGIQYGFSVNALPTICDAQAERISSTALRAALKSGDLELAKKLLGRPYMISGHVIHGKKLGRNLGFPTLNLAMTNQLHQRPPAMTGIYIVQVHGLQEKPLPGVASIGYRPTVEDQGRVLLETHLFDFQEEVYGRVIRVEFLKKLRDEAKYSDLASLKEAIEADATAARNYFKNLYV